MSCRNYFISMLCLSILSCSTENSTDTLSAIQVRTHMDETSSIATEKDLDEPIGIYLKTPGVLVIDTGAFTGDSGESVCPADGILQSGDYVVQIDHTDLKGKKDFVNRIKNSNGEQMIFTIQRNGEMSKSSGLWLPHR